MRETKEEKKEKLTEDDLHIVGDTVQYYGEKVKKLKNEITYVDQAFDIFKQGLLQNKIKGDVGGVNTLRSKYYINKLRTERGELSIEKISDKIVRLKSYGEVCEINLETGIISYMKGNELLSLDELGKQHGLATNHGRLAMVFGQMNVINRAMYMSKRAKTKEFYFEDGDFLDRFNLFTIDRYIDNKSLLKIGGDVVISIGALKEYFFNTEMHLNGTAYGMNVHDQQIESQIKFKTDFVNMLNRISQ